MNEVFEKAVTFTLKWEGGYVNDPDDPGGETNRGICKRDYPNENIKEMTEGRAKEIYYQDYWIPACCNNTTDNMAIAVFDTAVHCGVIIALRIATKGHFQDVAGYLMLRIMHYVYICVNNPKMLKYLRGWANRVIDLYNYINETT
jgi:lysozyme family protein